MDDLNNSFSDINDREINGDNDMENNFVRGFSGSNQTAKKIIKKRTFNLEPQDALNFFDESQNEILNNGFDRSRLNSMAPLKE